MNKQSVFGIVFLFFILTSLGYISSFKTLDPDFGWHLQTGALILEKGVPKIDWYSYTMPNFPWIDHEWLTDIAIYKIHSLFGFQVLLLVFLTLVSLAFILLIKARFSWYFFLPILLGYCSCLGFLGIRPQLLTILFIAILWKILRDFLDSDSKIIYLCPVLFIVWANLHGGFPAGFLLLFIVLISELFKKFKFSKKLISMKEQSFKKIAALLVLLILSFLATIINPYGLRIYEEIFRTVGDSFLRFHIAEWLPLFFTETLPIFTILYVSLFWGFFIIFRKKIDFTFSLTVLIFFGLALLNQRHFFIFVILSIPIFAQLIFELKKAIDQTIINGFLNKRKKLFALSVLSGILALCAYPTIKGIFEEPYLQYPEKALPFLRTLPLSENLLNEYAWGGWLIWRLPERKLFIDGRMPSWRQNNEFIFGDYTKIMKAEEELPELLKKYEIKIILLNKEQKIKALKKQEFKAENALSRFLVKHKWFGYVIGFHPLRKNLYQELINLGWESVYEDETAIILIPRI